MGGGRGAELCRHVFVMSKLIALDKPILLIKILTFFSNFFTTKSIWSGDSNEYPQQMFVEK